ncbi:3576_t:CDS:2, partial [Racocetra fulgida]
MRHLGNQITNQRTSSNSPPIKELEQKQLQNDSSNIIDTSPKLLEDDTGENNQSSIITPCKMNSDELNNAPNSDVSFEDNSSEQSNLPCEIKTLTNGNDQNLELASDTKTVNIDNNAELYSSDSSDEVSGLDRNQITEQTLKRDFTKSTVIVKSNEIDNELSLEKTTEDSTQRLAYWFEKAIKSGIKEILYWYTYSLETENKVENMTADGKIKEKTARSTIYKEMLKYLPNVTPGNLRIRTNRAKKFLNLFGENGVGTDKIKLVTCSASDISRLTNVQIQNIINYVKDYENSKTVTNGIDRIHVAEISTE